MLKKKTEYLPSSAGGHLAKFRERISILEAVDILQTLAECSRKITIMAHNCGLEMKVKNEGRQIVFKFL